jgi:deazaflavin-dependent oxidoreductase (nitroreductase family)
MEALRQGFKQGNRAMVLGWRLGAGSFMNRSWLSGQIMVITHRGRSSGRVYRTPVNYAMFGDDVYCIAGFGHRSDWYRNVLADPDVEIWLPSTTFGGPVSWWLAHAEQVTEEPFRLQRIRDVLVASGFAGRLDGFRPDIGEDELRTMSADFPLLRLSRVQARTGSGGPGDLDAVWQVVASVLAVVAVAGYAARRRSRSLAV